MQPTNRGSALAPLFRLSLRSIVCWLCAFSPLLADEISAYVRGDQAVKEGSACARRGDWSTAILRWQEAAKSYPKRSAARVDALLKLGSAYQLVGHHRLATTAAQQALIAAEKSDHRTLAEAKNLLGTLSAASRSTEVAERWFNEALSDASEAKDDATAGSILVNLGILHAAQRQYPDALASFTRSAELAERNTNALLLALARVNQTKAATLAEQWSEAERACELAAQALEALEPVHEKATLLLSLSLTFLQWAGRDAARHAGWLPRANQLCMQAAEIARQI